MGYSTVLIFDSDRIDIGVPVVTYEQAGAPSFYDPKLARNFSPVNPLFQGIQGKRKDAINKVVLHHDGTRSSRGCFDVLAQRGLSTHLMVDADGVIYQPMNLRDIAYHAGGVNNQSIGIDLNNPVRPRRVPDRSVRQIFEGRINGGHTVSLGYTDAQYESLIALLDGLIRTFPNIQRLAPIGPDGKVLRRRLINTGFAGVVGHLHVSANKWDPGPGFDWERVLIGVRGQRLYFPVTLPGTLNLANVVKRQALKTAEAYFRATEEGEGGYFPFGVNQAWHTGVHLPIEPGTPVVAPAAGKVLVARQEEPGRMGSPNFVLIEHELEVGEKKRRCFSVISHLRLETLDRTSEIPWIKALFLKAGGGARLPDDKRKSAPGAAALKHGRVALIDVPVKAGQLVGHSDTFSGDPEEEEPIGLIDFALIAAEPLVEKRDSTFEVVDEDDTNDILCNARPVWTRFSRKPEVVRGLSEGGYPLDPFEIRAYFSENRAAAQMRWLVVRHATEYSDQTDFSGLFGGGVDFEWSTRKQADRWRDRVRDFLWWDEGVTEHAKLPADRLVYAHHPIAALTMLARREAKKALQTGEGGPEAAYSEADLGEQRRKDAEEEAKYGAMARMNVRAARIDVEGGRDLDLETQEDPEGEGWMRWEQGEWDPD